MKKMTAKVINCIGAMFFACGTRLSRAWQAGMAQTHGLGKPVSHYGN
jgi:hypothetical protein